ncbi:hypothetical protein AYI68_g4515, partial [Smittium mucronatum]
MCLGKLFLILT